MSEEDVSIKLARVEEKLKALKDEMDSTFESNEVALQLKAKELERRLENLNGEAGRIALVLEKSVPREVFESKFNEIFSRFEEKFLSLAKVAAAVELEVTKKLSAMVSREIYEASLKDIIEKVDRNTNTMLPREVYDNHLKEYDNKLLNLALKDSEKLLTDVYNVNHKDLADRISKLELEAKEQKGKLWLPLMFVGALVVGSVTVVLRFILPP